MTYHELLQQLESMPSDRLHEDAFLHNNETGEYHPVKSLSNHDDDILEGYSVISFGKYDQ